MVWCEGEERSIPSQVGRKQSKDKLEAKISCCYYEFHAGWRSSGN